MFEYTFRRPGSTEDLLGLVESDDLLTAAAVAERTLSDLNLQLLGIEEATELTTHKHYLIREMKTVPGVVSVEIDFDGDDDLNLVREPVGRNDLGAKVALPGGFQARLYEFAHALLDEALDDWREENGVYGQIGIEAATGWGTIDYHKRVMTTQAGYDVF
jgi:hypothetical protein